MKFRQFYAETKSLFREIKGTDSDVIEYLKSLFEELKNRYEAQPTYASYGEKMAKVLQSEAIEAKRLMYQIIYHYSNRPRIRAVVTRMRKQGLDDLLSWQPQPF